MARTYCILFKLPNNDFKVLLSNAEDSFEICSPIDRSRSEVVFSPILIIRQGSICSNTVLVKREGKGSGCEMNGSLLASTFGRRVLLVCRVPARVPNF